MSIKGFNISGTTYKVDYPELDNLPQINGNDLVGNMSGESLGLREVAFMTYLGATNARVETLLNSGVKIVLVKVSTDGIPDNETTCRLVKRINRKEHHFASVSKNGRVYAILKDNRWSVTSETYAKPSDIPRAATTLPRDLGVALIGSRVEYARADHAHAMPAAEDVGAIPDPTTKSSGQVLTYNGYSWVASTPPGGVVDSALSSSSTNPVQNKVIKAALDLKADSADLAAVATSGSYNDLSNKPTIPSLTGYQTEAITDTGGYFTTDTVEGALQEIGAELAGINTLIGSGVIT